MLGNSAPFDVRLAYTIDYIGLWNLNRTIDCSDNQLLYQTDINLLDTFFSLFSHNFFSLSISFGASQQPTMTIHLELIN